MWLMVWGRIGYANGKKKLERCVRDQRCERVSIGIDRRYLQHTFKNLSCEVVFRNAEVDEEDPKVFDQTTHIRRRNRIITVQPNIKRIERKKWETNLPTIATSNQLLVPTRIQVENRRWCHRSEQEASDLTKSNQLAKLPVVDIMIVLLFPECLIDLSSLKDSFLWKRKTNMTFFVRNDPSPQNASDSVYWVFQSYPKSDQFNIISKTRRNDQDSKKWVILEKVPFSSTILHNFWRTLHKILRVPRKKCSKILGTSSQKAVALPK